jgi:hypothetical protein
MMSTCNVSANQSRAKVRILFEHPHAYRVWSIVGPDSIHLESSVRIGLGYYTERMTYTKFELCLHETEFERI